MSVPCCGRGKENSSMTIERARGAAFAVMMVVLGLVVGIAGSAAAGADSSVPAVNAAEGIGLKGYDPVAYFINGAPTKGSEQYSYLWTGVTYRFASAGNLEKFKADPEKYLPQYGGFCADANSPCRAADTVPCRRGVVHGKAFPE